MKKLLISVVASLFIMTSYIFAIDVTVNDDTKLTVNNDSIQNGNAPIEVNGISLIPLKPIIIKLGVYDDEDHIKWDDKERKITIIKEDGNIELKIDSNIGSVNGKEFKLEAPVTIYNNKTYIPLDFIKQVFNKKVILLPEDSIVLTRDEDEYATIKETLDNVNKAISKIEKLKIFVNMKADTDQMSAAPIFVDLDMNASIDSKNETGYVISTTSIYDTLIKNEVYFKNGVAYIRYQESKADNRKEKWETVSGEESIFNNIAEKFMRMIQLEIDENMYGLFTIDEEKSNSSILVMKNNLSCKSLIKKLINNQLILGTDSQIGEQDILGIEDIYVEYRISKKTYNPESMLIKLKIAPGDPDQSKNITEDINITIKFRNINGKFRVTKPE